MNSCQIRLSVLYTSTSGLRRQVTHIEPGTCVDDTKITFKQWSKDGRFISEDTLSLRSFASWAAFDEEMKRERMERVLANCEPTTQRRLF